jgi:predicted TIM-barrel fold metal-dependent hydrolase
MIIDFHRHLWAVLERYPAVRSLASGRHLDTESVQEERPDVHRRGQLILDEMAAAGIDATVVFLGDYGLRLGEGPLPVEDENRLTAELARAHPTSFVPFVGVDPRRPHALDLFRRGLDEWGMRGLKLHPGTGFSPDDSVCDPFFRLAGERGVPVVVHTGPMASPLLSATARPLLLDRVAVDFPQTTIVMQHAGQQAWWEEAVNIAFWKPNLVLELSMWQWTYQMDEAHFVRALAVMKERVGVERILFASDYPGLSTAMPLDEWIDVFRRLPDIAAGHGYDFDEDDVAAILGGNAARILNLDGVG